MKLKQIKVDGYKNLINCEVNLSDFNVLVGPNNSGKSNLLEIFSVLASLYIGDEDVRKNFIDVVGRGPIMCHLDSYKKKRINVQFVYEITELKKKWNVEYQVSFKFQENEVSKNVKGTFIKEVLAAKPLERRGPSSKYFERKQKELTVLMKNGRKKTYKIAKSTPSLVALKTRFSGHKGKFPNILYKMIRSLIDITQTSVIAINSDIIRLYIDEIKEMQSMVIRSFGFSLLGAIDEIYKNNKIGRLYENLLCDILDLESAHLYTQDISAPMKRGKGTKSEEKIERILRYFIKKKGDKYSNISQYSDGTFAVASILAAVLYKPREQHLLCIEEPENYMHPAALKKLMRFLQDNAHKFSVLITTHSPYLLNGVNPENVIVAVANEKTAAVHFEKVHNTKQLRDYLKSGFMSFGDMLVSNFEDVLGK